MNEHLVTTVKRQFVHRRKNGQTNTICGAMPKFYNGSGLIKISREDAAKLHKCRACFSKP